MKEIGVGILGFGTVGAGVAEGLLRNRKLMAERLGVDIVLKKIADLDITTDRGIAVPDGFEGGAALDFASAFWCWTVYHLTVSFKWIGAGALALAAAAMMAINFIRIRKEAKQ